MRLLHITPVYSPAIGGIVEVVSNLARHSRLAGIEVDIVHVEKGLTTGQRTQGDTTVMTLPRIGHRVLGWAPGLQRLVADYDLLHVHDPQVGSLTMSICGNTRVPAVLSTHGGFFHTRSAMLAKQLHARVSAPLLLRRYTRVLASSATDFATFRKYSADTVLVQNGVDTARFSQQPACSQYLRRWIYWGRFSRNKRLDSLLHLVAALAQQGITIDLALCGIDFDGTLPGLRTLVTKLNLEKQITFHIGLDDEALRAEIRTRTVFVLPSEYEGFGLSILEAMAAGLVPVCRDIAPMNALGGSSAVLLDFDGGPEDLARIRRLLAESVAQTDRRRESAIDQATSFDWRTRIQAFLQQYEACLHQHEPDAASRDGAGPS